MKALTKIAAGGIGLAALAAAAPAAAQYYPNPYPAPSPYGYGYGQGGIGAIIESILGGNRYRYGVDQRALVERCINVVTNEVARRNARYRAPYGSPYGYGYGGYGNGYGQQGPSARVLGITDIDQRRNSLRVRGVATAGLYAAAPYGAPYGGAYGAPYGQAYGYGQQQVGELTFRCDVDHRGRVTNVDIDRNRNAYRYRR